MGVTIESVLELVAVQLGRRRVAPGDRFIEDLGAESLDVVNIVAAVEDRFGVEIRESDVPELRTADDLVAHLTRILGGSE